MITALVPDTVVALHPYSAIHVSDNERNNTAGHNNLRTLCEAYRIYTGKSGRPPVTPHAPVHPVIPVTPVTPVSPQAPGNP